jgi:hypothetical protein
MGRLSAQAQWAILIGGYIGVRFLRNVGQANPRLAPFIFPITVAYTVFAILTWIADPLFNLLLRLNRFGRLVLDREQTVASNFVGACILLALLSLGGCVVFGFDGGWLAGALVYGLLVIPLSGTFRCSVGWPRQAMAAYAGAMALVGTVAVALHFVGAKGTVFRDLGVILLGLFALGAILSGWVANFLIMQRPRR